MTRRLVLAIAGLVALVALALAIPLANVVATDQRAAFVSQLEVDTLAAASLLSSQPADRWPATVEDVAQRTGARVVVVDSSLVLLADSDNSSLDRAFDRPEIRQALGGALASDVRPSATMGEDLRFVAAPIVSDLGVTGAVRLSLAESEVEAAVQSTIRWLALFVVCVVLAAALVAWLIARSVVAPLRRLARVAHELPEDLSLRADERTGPPEVVEVAGALNSTADRLSAMLSRTRRVAAEASHHLRTPLTGVRLRLESIEDTSEDPAVRADARAATAEVDRLTRRIDQVLSLARTDAGQAVSEEQGASAIVAARADEARPLFDERGVALHASIESGIVVSAPPGVIARVIDELLGNALEYARARVDVTLRREGAVAVLEVADDGPGVPAEERPRIFERFVRGATAVPGGSGLGLALVQESVAALGGSASADAAALGGLLVRVTLPVAAGR